MRRSLIEPVASLRRRPGRRGDRGSVIPLILGFWLVGMYVVAAAIALGDAFTGQRTLQSICDGAAVAAANTVRTDVLHYGGTDAAALPLGDTSPAVARFLARDGGRDGVQFESVVTQDTVTLHCTRSRRVTFGRFIGKPGGVTQSVYSSARSPLQP
ncbi:MAG: pilus assembly protein TadG-related protein [bacterium]